MLGVALLGVLAVNARQWLRPGTASSPPASVLRIGSTPPTRQVGDTFALQATVVGSSGGARSDVRWWSNDNAVVRINAGDSVFRAMAPGTAVRPRRHPDLLVMRECFLKPFGQVRC